ncbi:MAG: hypothetical protein ABH867_00990 [Patescibacteria group bacterium]|nr:hypothetical protein [Patescibacteria group bacterium]
MRRKPLPNGAFIPLEGVPGGFIYPREIHGFRQFRALSSAYLARARKRMTGGVGEEREIRRVAVLVVRE